MQRSLKRSATPCSEQKCRIESAVRDQLRKSSYYAVRRISCEFDGDILKLRGRVSSYFEKQIAQSLALVQLDGDVIFENQVEVVTRAAR